MPRRKARLSKAIQAGASCGSPAKKRLILTQSALPVALALLGAHAQAQTNPNDVAQAAIAAIAAMAAQSAQQTDGAQGAQLTQSAIAAITRIATGASDAEIAKANATIALASAGRVPAAADVLEVARVDDVKAEDARATQAGEGGAVLEIASADVADAVWVKPVEPAFDPVAVVPDKLVSMSDAGLVGTADGQGDVVPPVSPVASAVVAFELEPVQLAVAEPAEAPAAGSEEIVVSLASIEPIEPFSLPAPEHAASPAAAEPPAAAMADVTDMTDFTRAEELVVPLTLPELADLVAAELPDTDIAVAEEPVVSLAAAESTGTGTGTGTEIEFAAPLVAPVQVAALTPAAVAVAEETLVPRAVAEPADVVVSEKPVERTVERTVAAVMPPAPAPAPAPIPVTPSTPAALPAEPVRRSLPQEVRVASVNNVTEAYLAPATPSPSRAPQPQPALAPVPAPVKPREPAPVAANPAPSAPTKPAQAPEVKTLDVAAVSTATTSSTSNTSTGSTASNVAPAQAEPQASQVPQAAQAAQAPQPRPAPPGTPAKFNPSLLAFPVDVEMFAEGTPVPPGTYRVDVYLNDSWYGKHSVVFEALTPGDLVALPCFSLDLLETLGLDLSQVNPDTLAELQSGKALCVPIEDIVAHVQAKFDVGQQRLSLAAPQIVLLRQPRGYVDPSRWDAGITAGTLTYDYNVWHNRQPFSRQTSHYLGLRGGINVGDWRLRYRGSVTRSDNRGLQYHSNSLYVERALPAWSSTVVAGESITRSQVFDGLPFLGVRLETEDRMRPDSMHGFAPVIRGIAQSNAKVSVSQRDMQIFETTVPPGPFEINDLHPNGSGGDLLVTITEADGSQHSFTVTYNSLPELLRPGVTRYTVSAGRYRNQSLVKEPLIAVGGITRGLTNTVTAYGGALAGGGYNALSAGVGLNLSVGAVTFDATYARTGSAASGVGLRLGYSRRLNDTGTDITLAMLRHATSGYYEPVQGFAILDQIRRGRPFIPTQRPRSQLSLYLNQQLPGAWGSISFAGSVQNYWQRSGTDAQYSIGYGRAIGRVSVNFNVMRSRETYTGRWNNQYLLSFSMPLGETRPAYFSTSLSHRPGGQSVQTSVSGSAGDQRQHTYSVYASADRSRGQSVQTRGGASFGTTTSFARVSTSVAVGARGSRQLSMSASGGMVGFKGGLVFSPDLGETIGLVQAPDAAGVRLAGYSGSQLNSRGHAVVPWLQAYRENEVHLDTKGSGMDVEFASTSQKVAPTAGAVVLLQYKTRRGYAILMTLKRRDGSPAPFAAGVFDAEGKNVGYVSQGGQALVRVEGAQGELTVRWGAQPDQQCRFEYTMDDEGKPQAGQGGEKSGEKSGENNGENAVSQAGTFRRVEAVCREVL